MVKNERRKSIFRWNHISNTLTENDVEELKSYYHTYHKKAWAYKKAWKRFKKIKLFGDIASILFASGGIAASAASGGIALIGVSGVSIIIQSWMAHQTLDLKIHNCQYAYQSYGHIMIEIKESMRRGSFNRDHLVNMMTNIDNYVTDNSPPVDKFLKKWHETFID